VGRLTGPLGIEDRSTVALLIVDGSGTVQWSGAGGFDLGATNEIDTVLHAR
jgi:hypothetical protein